MFRIQSLSINMGGGGRTSGGVSWGFHMVFRVNRGGGGNQSLPKEHKGRGNLELTDL